MTQKRCSYFSKVYPPFSFSGGDELFITLGVYQVVVMVKHAVSKQIEAMELFTLDAKKNWQKDLSHIKTMSELLSRKFAQTHIIYHFPEALVVPEPNFSLAASHDFLDQIFGEKSNNKILFDKPSHQKDMVVAYRIEQSVIDWVQNEIPDHSNSHKYQFVLNELFKNPLPEKNYQWIQLYQSSLIIMLCKNKQLQFIQSFEYEKEEDILYYLINIQQQFEITPETTQLQISGELNKNSVLGSQLPNLFGKIHWENSQTTGVFGKITTDFPPHFFTPFYNLVV